MTLQVQLILPNGARRLVQLPADVIVGRLLPALVSKLALPLVDEAGQARHYELLAEAEPLDPEQTLAEHGVTAGAALQLTVTIQRWEQPPHPDPEPAMLHLSREEVLAQPVAPSSQPGRRDRPDGAWRNPVRAIFIAFWFVVVLARCLDDAFDGGPALVESSQLQVAAALATREANQLMPSPTPAPAIPAGPPTLVTVRALSESQYVLLAGAEGLELWLTRPDTPGPQLFRKIKDIKGPAEGLRRELAIWDDDLLFWSGQAPLLWRYSPESGLLAPAGFMTPLAGHVPVVLGDTFLYRALDADSPSPLLAVTDPVKPAVELPVTVSATWYDDLVELDGILYFAGYTPEHGHELWRTDGSVVGTWLVKDINPGPASAAPAHFVQLDDLFFVVALSENNDLELWQSRGSETGTVVKATLADSGARLSHLALLSDMLFYAITDLDGRARYQRYDLAADRLATFTMPDMTISQRPQQTGVGPDGYYFLATVAGRSQLGQGVLGGNRFRWLATAPPGVQWDQLYVSPTQLVILDSRGAGYQFLPGTQELTPVGEWEAFTQVAVEATGDFLLSRADGAILRLTTGDRRYDVVVWPNEWEDIRP